MSQEIIVGNGVLPRALIARANSEIVDVLTFVSDNYVFNLNVYDNAKFPIFCAKEIGDMVGIMNARTVVSNIEHQHRRVLKLNKKDQNGLTLRGLCAFVSPSRKEKAIIFTSLIFDFLSNTISSANDLAASCLQLTIERDALAAQSSAKTGL